MTTFMAALRVALAARGNTLIAEAARIDTEASALLVECGGHETFHYLNARLRAELFNLGGTLLGGKR